MEETDEAMIPHIDMGMPITVYPPLPPYTDDDLTLTEIVTRKAAVIQGGETRRQVEALAQNSVAVQQMTAEQLGQVQRRQEHLAAQTTEYLQQQHDRQSALLEQQNETKRQMEEHWRFLKEQFQLLKAAEEAVGLQGKHLENLAEAVQPHLQARWGAFEQGASPLGVSRQSEIPAVTVAAGTSFPVPPIYGGSSKKEKRDFMDSYAIYTRRIKALNQCTQTSIFVMPLSACIEQSTLVRICDEKGVIEMEWKTYFLSAHLSDLTAYKALEKEVKSLYMNTELKDAESRLLRFFSDCGSVKYRGYHPDRAKKLVGYLVDALRPPAFRVVVKDQLERQSHKSTKANIQTFLKWLRAGLEGFMRKVTQNDSNQVSKQSKAPKLKPTAPSKTDKNVLSVENKHMCPNIVSPMKAKEIYEKSTGKKVMKPILATTSDGSKPDSAASIPCIVMEAVQNLITPDSAASVSMVTVSC
ncbi:hypothetical protein PHPALM_31081 [Phytophthora palmivora]|uniref:Uncharacterized protein n=1 Tax=Phytophthora palmivora TaxID=4796 RepID=A0A2P4X3H5_9STRA|nr:hypothetical protein PHPALM_31081 [Phytophthora palmivora]